MTTDYLGPGVLKPWLDEAKTPYFHRVIRVSLDGPNYDDRTMEVLASLKQLRIIELRNTKVTSAGLADFAKVRPECQIIRRT